MAIVTANNDGGEGVLIAVKAVPGAKRDEVAGRLGERLKIRVAAPPEGGKANKAICTLLASVLKVKPAGVRVVRGTSSPEKTVQVDGISVERAIIALDLRE